MVIQEKRTMLGGLALKQRPNTARYADVVVAMANKLVQACRKN
jgi:hypothetical protein